MAVDRSKRSHAPPGGKKVMLRLHAWECDIIDALVLLGEADTAKGQYGSRVHVLLTQFLQEAADDPDVAQIVEIRRRARIEKAAERDEPDHPNY